MGVEEAEDGKRDGYGRSQTFTNHCRIAVNKGTRKKFGAQEDGQDKLEGRQLEAEVEQ